MPVARVISRSATIMLMMCLLGGCTSQVTLAEPEPTLNLPPTGGFDYQLGGAYEPPEGTTIVARDQTEAPASGYYNICYVNGFQTQPGLASEWEPLLLQGADGPIADPAWPDESLLDTSTDANRTQIAARMVSAIDACATAGFDAVEFDNLDSYLRADGRLTAQDNLALAKQLVTAAHDAGLAAAQKNGLELAGAGVKAGFDFAVTEQCGAFNECAGYADHYDTVLNIEYSSASAFAAMCANGALPAQSVRRDVTLQTPRSTHYAFQRCE